MSKDYLLDGIAASVELSKGGARVKNNSGVVEARNNADDALAIMRGADAVGSTDLVTKSQLDAIGTSKVQAIRAAFTYTDNGTVNIGSALPANAEVTKVIVNVDTVFDGTTPTLEIGDSGDTDRLMASAGIDLETVGTYVTDLFNAYGSSTQVTGTLTLTSATQGSGTVIVEYYAV